MAVVQGLVVTVVACASDPALVAFDDAVMTAERRLWAGDAAGAAQDFARLEAAAPSPGERVEMRLRTAEALRQAGDVAEALQRVRALRRDDTLRPRTLSASKRAKVAMAEARLLLDSGDEAAGRAALRGVVERFPRSEWAPRALQLLSLRARENPDDHRAFVSWCRARFAAAPGSDLADNLAWEVGHYHFERGTEADDAIASDVYASVLGRFTIRSSGLWDDALWELSLIHHRRGRYAEELALLERFLAERVEASAPGSYEHVNYKHAWMRIARLYLDQLGQPRRAAELLAEFPEVFDRALMRAEARYVEAQAWDAAGEPTRAQAARDALVRDYPDSRWTRRVLAERGPQ